MLVRSSCNLSLMPVGAQFVQPQFDAGAQFVQSQFDAGLMQPQVWR